MEFSPPGKEFWQIVGRKSEESSAEEDHGGVGDRGQQGTDRPQAPLRPQCPRLHGRQDQGGETAGEKYILAATNFQTTIVILYIHY